MGWFRHRRYNPEIQRGEYQYPQLQISEFLTPQEAAAILKVSVKTVIRRFENFPGVVNLGSEETRRKRRYTVLRIPREALEKFIVENRV